MEKILSDLNIPLSTILVNTGDSTVTKDEDIRNFNNLDVVGTEGSKKQFIILVEKGREGWNCRSLLGIALFRSPSSKIFVLQATMRCLRKLTDEQLKATVFLSKENMDTLDDELKKNYNMELKDLGKTSTAEKHTYKVRVMPPERKIRMKRIWHEYSLVDKGYSQPIDFGISAIDMSKYDSVMYEKESLRLNMATKEKKLDTSDSQMKFSEISLVGEIARYLNISCILVSKIIREAVDGEDEILKAINTHNEILYDVVIPKVFHALYEVKGTQKSEDVDMVLLRQPKDAGYYEFSAKDELVVSKDNKVFTPAEIQKSFHADTYCFDSKPELECFKQYISSDKVKEVYFTGMFTSNQGDLSVHYYDPESKRVRQYYPDFLALMDDGTYQLIEVKGDHMIDNEVVLAKKEAAEEMSIASGMRYLIYASSILMKRIMLREIRCDKFRTYNDKPRDPIVFHPGLNVVLGTNDAKNSIGKSTFLMIVDFVFGGKDYVQKCTDVQEMVKGHTIEFCFEFDDGLHYYSRSTIDTARVNRCDEKYNVVDTISLTTFYKELAKGYHVDDSLSSFRGMVNPYFRVYQKENMDEKAPLDIAKKGKAEDAINELLKLFDMYDLVQEYKQQEKANVEQKDIYSKSFKYDIVRKIGEREYKANKARILELQAEIEELEKTTAEADLSLLGIEDPRIIEQIGLLKDELRKANRRLSKYRSQLRVISANRNNSTIGVDGDIELLREFFPDADIKHIKEIESFHSRIQEILSDEFSDAEAQVRSLISAAEDEQAILEKEIRELGVSKDFSTQLFKKYADLRNELEELQRINNAHEKIKEHDDAIEEAKENTKIAIKDELALLQKKINDKMEALNRYIYNDDSESPVISISEDGKKYEFFTPYDSGAGTSCKGLILFDLAILEMTVLPALIHDSDIHKRIEDYSFGKILDLYQQSGKQVFISMDRQETFSSEIAKKLEDAEVLYLSGNGNELFGKDWKKKSNRK